MSCLNLFKLLLVLVAVCFGIGDATGSAHSRLTVRRAGDQQRQLVGQVMRHGSLVFRVESFDGFLRKVPQLTTDKLLGKGGFGTVYSVKILEDDNARGLKKGNFVVVKAGCSTTAPDLVWEHKFHAYALAKCPGTVPILYGDVVTLDDKDPESGLDRMVGTCARKMKQFLFMEKMNGTLIDIKAVQPLLQNKNRFLGELVLPLMNALQCYHKASIFHRDVKPENILFRQFNRKFFFKFGDFGVAMNISAPSRSSGIPDIILDKEYEHGTDILTAALAYDVSGSDSYMQSYTYPTGERILPPVVLRRHIDTAALALAIRMAYTQNSAIRTNCFLSFKPCSGALAQEGGSNPTIRDAFLAANPIVPAGVAIPVLNQVLDDLMKNEITLPSAIEKLEKEVVKTITLDGKVIPISNKVLSPDEGIKLKNNLSKRIAVIHKNKLQSKDNLKNGKKN